MIVHYINQSAKSLQHYLEVIIQRGAKASRPSRCTHCGKANPWCHGSYQRKMRPEVGGESSEPVRVPIFRYLCRVCKHTFSVLPKFISPRRWYIWAIQQTALLLTISGRSLTDTAKQLAVGRNTCQRWVRSLKNKLDLHAFYLRSRFSELGRNNGSFPNFWGACLKQMSLAEAMCCIYRDGRAILR